MSLKAVLLIGISGTIIFFLITLLLRILKDSITKKQSKHHSKKEIINSKIDTVYSQLDTVENYHRIKKVSSDMLVFMNEYSVNIIMTKDYSGTITIRNGMWVVKEGKKDTPIQNIYDEFNDKELNLKLLSYDCKRFLLLGEFCILNETNPKIEIIRMNNLFFKVNKIEIKKKYTKEQIDEYIDNM